jgi:hypothetical protein
MSIYKWYKWFDPTGCICKGKSPKRQTVTKAQMNTIQAAFIPSPCKSTWHASRQFFLILSGVRLSPLGTVATTGLLYQPQMIDVGDCGEIDGMMIGRGNRSTQIKPAPAPLCPPQIPRGPPWWEASD